jgi:predicted alpha/beta hydrolase family esterase
MHSGEPSSFLILHGYENRRPASHWQRWLSLELTARGHDVRYPQLPDPDHPDLRRWRDLALANLATLTEGTTTVIAHSASALLWLHEQSSGSGVKVDRVALVAPPEASIARELEAVRAFAWPPEQGGGVQGGGVQGGGVQDRAPRLHLGADDAIVVVGTGDPFAPNGAAGIAPFVDARTVELEGAGHITPATGFGPWPEMLAWCEGRPAFGA